MAMPPSKYERELRFIDTELNRLNRELKERAESIPADPAEAARKVEDVVSIQRSIASLVQRKKEIEDSYVAAGMDIPDTHRSMNASVHNAGAFETYGASTASRAESSSQAGASASAGNERADAAGPDPLDPLEDMVRMLFNGLTGSQGRDSRGPESEVMRITAELTMLEARIVDAQMSGDESAVRRLSERAAELRRRRDELAAKARESRAAPEAERKGDDDDVASRLEALEADNRALRAQVSDLRCEVQDLKDAVRRLTAAFGHRDL